MNVRVHSVVGSAVLVFGLAAVVGCGRTSPASPSSAAASAAPAAVTSGPASSDGSIARRATGADPGSPLVSGTFTIATDAGDGLVGTYTGTAYSSPPRALLSMNVTAGSGAYAGASGSMSATGVGAFSGEGSFGADLKGDVVVNGKHVPVRVGLTGTSAVTCPDSHFVATLSATGTMKRTGDVHATLSHTVLNAGCAS